MTQRQPVTTRTVCLLLAVAAVLGGCGRSVEVKFRPAVGDSRTFEVKTTETTAMTMMGNETEIPMSTRMVLTQAVESVDASGGAAIKVTFDEVDLGSMAGLGSAMGLPGGDIDGIAGDLGLTGKSFTMKVTPMGRVEEVSGMQAVVDELTRKTNEFIEETVAGMDLPPEAKAMMPDMTAATGAQMRRMLGDRAMEEEMEDGMTMYTDSPVRVGGSWARGVVRSAGMAPMIRSESWKLVGRKEGRLTLQYAATVSPNPDARAVNMGLGTMSMELSGQITGTCQLEEATGWLVRADMTHQLEGSMKMTMAAMPAPGGGAMTINSKTNKTVTVESVSR